MSKLISFTRSLAKNDDGATMIEYSLLIGLITVAMIASLTVIGPWIAQQWQALQGNLNL